MAERRDDDYIDTAHLELESMLYARHAELESLSDLTQQRGTPIPALFSQFYKFIQNPSSVSIDTFKRMVDTDDTVGSGVDFLTTCLAARLGRYQHPSREITQWVNDRLEEIEGGLVNAVKEILSATWAGFYCGEKVWSNTDNGFVLRKIVSLPPSTVLFETDRGGELLPDGILQYQRNYNPVALGMGVNFFGGMAAGGLGFATDAYRPDMFAKFGDLPFPMRTGNTFNYLSIRIPRQKVIHYSFDAQGKFGNPYGRSLLRRAYKYYVMKDAILQMLAIALDRKGTPLTVVFADNNVTLMDPEKKGAGQNMRGQKVGIRADEAAQKAFKNVHNDTTIILPGKKGQIYDTAFVPQDSNSSAFIDSLNFCNKSLMRALLLPSLIFTSGDGSGSYSLGQEHARTFDKILDGMLAGLKHVLVQQLIVEMIAYNFPRSAWEKDGPGDFSKREFSQEEKQKEAEMFERAINMGVLDANDMNDLNQMRDTLGFEPREMPIEKPLDVMNPFGAPAENPFGAPGEEIEPASGDTKKGGKTFKPEENFKMQRLAGAIMRLFVRPDYDLGQRAAKRMAEGARKEVASVAVMNGGKLLMGVRNDNGRWTLPGGHLNDGEDPHAGALRELMEEAGIQAEKLEHLGSDGVKTHSGKSYVIHAYRMAHEGEPPTTKLDPDQEVKEWRWVDVSKGLPEEVLTNLHSPRNLVLEKLGLM